MKENITEKFELFVDLGIVVVPNNLSLDLFKKKNRKRKFSCYDKAITDENFSRATTKLVSGQKLKVKVFKQVKGGTTTSEERLEFYESQNALLVGAQGIPIVFKQKRENLPIGFWYASFDERYALWEDKHGDHGVPNLFRYSDKCWDFLTYRFEDDWWQGYCMLLFYLLN